MWQPLATRWQLMMKNIDEFQQELHKLSKTVNLKMLLLNNIDRNLFHNHFKCPAQNSECNTCGKTGYWAKVRQSRWNQKVTVVININELCTILVTAPHCLASSTIQINNYSALALTDSVSSSSFINYELAQILKSKMKPFTCSTNCNKIPSRQQWRQFTAQEIKHLWVKGTVEPSSSSSYSEGWLWSP